MYGGAGVTVLLNIAVCLVAIGYKQRYNAARGR